MRRPSILPWEKGDFLLWLVNLVVTERDELADINGREVVQKLSDWVKSLLLFSPKFNSKFIFKMVGIKFCAMDKQDSVLDD